MSAVEFSPGQILDHYRILARIGQGGMGVVYRAVDIGLGRNVAIKVLDTTRVTNAEAQTRFHREAAAAAQLKHPNIAAVYEFGAHEAQPFIVLEWIQGETLHAYLQREKKLPLARALEIFSEIADALAYAHSRGVTHRDVKPANILLTADGHATLVDFGLVGLAQDTDATLGGNYFGSPRYMAPEQIRGHTTDGRADEYALALVLYEMLAGQPAFDAPTTAALFHQQLYTPPPPLSETRADVPRDVERAIVRALEKNPDARFANVAAFRDAVRAAAQPARAKKLQWRWLGLGAVFGMLGAALLLFNGLVPNIPPATPTTTPSAIATSDAPTTTPSALATSDAPDATPSALATSDAPTETPVEPSPAPTPISGGIWKMPGGNSAHTNLSADFLQLNPNPRWQTDAQGAPVSAIVVGGGVVIVPLEGGIVRAFDWANGTQVWETNLGAPIGASPALFSSAERVYVFVPTSDSELHALDAANGKLVWRKKQAELLGNIVGSVTLADDGTLYVATDNGYLSAIEPTGGTVYWTLDTYKDLGFVQPPTLANSALLLASSSKIFVLASTLEQVWQAEMPSPPSAPLTALVSQGLAAVGTEQGNVKVYNVLLGRETWSAEVKGAVNGFATDDWFLFATTREGVGYAWIASSGELAWSFEFGSPIHAAPLSSAGVLIVTLDDGRVFHFLPYSNFQAEPSLDFQIPDTITFTPAPASDWLFARGRAVWGFGP